MSWRKPADAAGTFIWGFPIPAPPPAAAADETAKEPDPKVCTDGKPHRWGGHTYRDGERYQLCDLCLAWVKQVAES